MNSRFMLVAALVIWLAAVSIASAQLPGPPDIAPAAGSVRIMPGAGVMLHSVAVSPDGDLVVVGGTNATFYAWSLSTGEFKWSFGDPEPATVWHVAFAPDGARVAVADHDSVYFLSTEDGALLGGMHLQIYRSPYETRGLAFSADGRLLACAKPFYVYVYDTQTDKLVWKSEELASDVRCLAAQPGNKPLLVAGLDEHASVAWDFNTGAVVDPPGGMKSLLSAEQIAFSRDGRKAIAVGYADGRAAKPTVGGLFDLTLGTMKPIAGITSPMALSLSGKLAAFASEDGKSAVLWDCQTGKEITRLSGHTDAITAMTFTPDERALVTVSYDKSLRVWDLGKYVPAAASNPDPFAWLGPWNYLAVAASLFSAPTVTLFSDSFRVRREPKAGGKRFASHSARVDDAAVYARVRWRTAHVNDTTIHVCWSGPDGKSLLEYDKVVKTGGREVWVGMPVKATGATKPGKYTVVVTQDGIEIGRGSIGILAVTGHK